MRSRSGWARLARIGSPEPPETEVPPLTENPLGTLGMSAGEPGVARRGLRERLGLLDATGRAGGLFGATAFARPCVVDGREAAVLVGVGRPQPGVGQGGTREIGRDEDPVAAPPRSGGPSHRLFHLPPHAQPRRDRPELHPPMVRPSVANRQHTTGENPSINRRAVGSRPTRSGPHPPIVPARCARRPARPGARDGVADRFSPAVGLTLPIGKVLDIMAFARARARLPTAEPGASKMMTV